MYQIPSQVLALIAVAVFAANSAEVSQVSADDKSANRIQPYAKNPFYWQYKGEPVAAGEQRQL